MPSGNGSCRNCGEASGRAYYCSDSCRPKCAVDGCCGLIHARGYCGKHSAELGRRGAIGLVKRPWSSEWICVLCGEEVQKGSGYRKYCSKECCAMYNRHKGGRPQQVNCVRCSTPIDLMQVGSRGHRKRADTKLCDLCRKSRNKRHGVSVSELAARDGWDCGICGQPVDPTNDGPMKPSVDHIKPYSLGGSHDMSNLQVAHLQCNLIKLNRDGFTLNREQSL